MKWGGDLYNFSFIKKVIRDIKCRLETLEDDPAVPCSENAADPVEMNGHADFIGLDITDEEAVQDAIHAYIVANENIDFGFGTHFTYTNQQLADYLADDEAILYSIIDVIISIDGSEVNIGQFADNDAFEAGLEAHLDGLGITYSSVTSVDTTTPDVFADSVTITGVEGTDFTFDYIGRTGTTAPWEETITQANELVGDWQISHGCSIVDVFPPTADLTVADTASVLHTLSPARQLTSNVNIDVDPDNIITLSAAGLKVLSDLVDQQQVIYVGKHGNDGNTGFNEEEAKLTINNAITYIDAQSHIEDNRWLIQILDGGTYNENFIVMPDYVSLYGPSAKIIGNFTLKDECAVHVHTVYSAGTGRICFYADSTVTGAWSYAKANRLYIGGTGDTFVGNGVSVTSNSKLFIDIGHIDVPASSEGLFPNADGELYGYVGEIELSGISSTAAKVRGPINVTIDYINGSGDDATSVGIQMEQSDQVANVRCNKLEMANGDTYELTLASTTLNLYVTELIGTPGTVTGTANIHSPSNTGDGYIGDTSSHTAGGDLDMNGNDVDNIGWLAYKELLSTGISSGTLTLTKVTGFVNVQGEATSDDDLVTLTVSGVSDGDILILRADPLTDITIKDTGNIKVSGDPILTDENYIVLVYDGSNWLSALPLSIPKNPIWSHSGSYNDTALTSTHVSLPPFTDGHNFAADGPSSSIYTGGTESMNAVVWWGAIHVPHNIQNIGFRGWFNCKTTTSAGNVEVVAFRGVPPSSPTTAAVSATKLGGAQLNGGGNLTTANYYEFDATTANTVDAGDFVWVGVWNDATTISIDYSISFTIYGELA